MAARLTELLPEPALISEAILPSHVDTNDAISRTEIIITDAPSMPAIESSTHEIPVAPVASRNLPDVTSTFPVQPFVRLGIHDTSRLEWSVSVPFPEERALKYDIQVELEIPANVFARHSPWDQLQSFTRLDGPTETGRNVGVSIDSLRRAAVAIANRLSKAADGFGRQCRLAVSVVEPLPPKEVEASMMLWIDATVDTARDARKRVGNPLESDSPEIAKERSLVDEYVSLRLLKALASVERALLKLQKSPSLQKRELASILPTIESKLADALEVELNHRATKGFLNPDPKSPVALERYLERQSLLKKHFQEVLFLDAETYQVAERLHHWVASIVAVFASTWAFAFQIFYFNHRPSTASSVGSGIVLLAVIAGVVYAIKDRIKEYGRVWLSGNMHRFYAAQRISKYRAPIRRVKSREVIVHAKESFDITANDRPDPLNPVSGATVRGQVLRYVHRGTVYPHADLRATGVHRIKHVFRYDLSPVFARLDDAIKQVPVLAVEDHRVRFIDAPRCYRVPLKITVHANGQVAEESVQVVLHKRGLDRIEKSRRIVDLKESGLEPDHMQSDD